MTGYAVTFARWARKELATLTEKETTYPDQTLETLAFGTYAETNRLSVASYDTAGNMTSWAGYGLAYDAVHQLLSLSLVDSDRYYAYTADDERILVANVPDSGTTKMAFTPRDLGGQVLSQRVGGSKEENLEEGGKD